MPKYADGWLQESEVLRRFFFAILQCRSTLSDAINGLPPGLCAPEISLTKTGAMFLEMPCHLLRLCGIDLCQGLHPVPTLLGSGSDNRHGRNQLLYILTPASGAAWRILMACGADQRLVLPLT